MLRRRILIALGMVAAYGLVCAAMAAAQGPDVWTNVSPAGPVVEGASRLINTYPLSRYGLDWNVDMGVTNLGGLVAGAMHGIAELIWAITRAMSNLAIQALVWAFDVDLISGQGVPGTSSSGGVLGPVSDSIIEIYESTFGRAWLMAAIAAAGLWAMWTALIKQQHAKTLQGLGVSVLCVGIAMLFVTQPRATIGGINNFSNDVTRAMLSVADGPGGSGDSAVADRLFRLTIHDPWTVLQFGGLQHCVTENGAARCIDHQTPQGAHGGYAARFLAFPGGSKERAKEMLALSGEVDAVSFNYGLRDLQLVNSDQLKKAAEYAGVPVGQLPARTRAAFRDGYRPDDLDHPASDLQQGDGWGDRVVMSVLIFVGNLGIALLVGMIALGIILAQLLLLLFCGLAPFALVAAAIPGRGHDVFRFWLGQMILWFSRKIVYAAILTVILAVAGALQSGLKGAPWLVMYALTAAFFWLVLVKRDDLTGMFSRFGATDRHSDAVTAELNPREMKGFAAPALAGGALGYLSGRAAAGQTMAAARWAGRKGVSAAGRGADAAGDTAKRRYTQAWTAAHLPRGDDNQGGAPPTGGTPPPGGDSGGGPAAGGAEPGGSSVPALPAGGGGGAAGAWDSAANGHGAGAGGGGSGGAPSPTLTGAGVGVGSARERYGDVPAPPWMRDGAAGQPEQAVTPDGAPRTANARPADRSAAERWERRTAAASRREDAPASGRADAGASGRGDGSGGGGDAAVRPRVPQSDSVSGSGSARGALERRARWQSPPDEPRGGDGGER